MHIKNLAATSFEEVMSCFFSAFKGYFVELPRDMEYWKKRFLVARVDWELSFGMFDGENLVGFIINGIDSHNNKLTAFNTGTGVLEDYRGRAVVNKLYKKAIPLLKQQGVEKCLLEVICENKTAIRAYERTGFHISRKLCSYSGRLPGAAFENSLQKCHFEQVIKNGLYHPEFYSWDNTLEAIALRQNEVQLWCRGQKESPEAYLVIASGGNILQLESQTEDYEGLLNAAASLAETVSLKNLDSKRVPLIKTLEKWNFSNPVNQYEMELLLDL